MTDKSRIRIYGSETCSFCMAARMLLKKKGLAYQDIAIGGDDELRRKIETLSGQRTVPQIFIDDRPIGGFDELYELEKSGDLDRLLASVTDA